MTSDIKEFIAFMLENNVLKFGSFTLKSGRASPYFINTGSYTNGEALSKLGEFYAKKVYSLYKDSVEVVFGPAYKGIPLAVLTSLSYYKLYGKKIEYSCNRKEVKEHGEKGSFLGYKISGGERVVIVEDVLTSGRSIDEVVPLIKGSSSDKSKVNILGEVVSFNRMEAAFDAPISAKERIKEKYGIEVNAICCLKDLVEYIESSDILEKYIKESDIKNKLKEYYNTYGTR